jgi:tRNA modification GTPase
VVEVRLVLAGVPVTLADTAGLREAADDIEAEGIRRALRRAETAEIRLLVLAGEPDAATLALAGPGAVLVQNKADLGGAPHPGALPVSARDGTGLEALRARLAAEVGARAGASGLTRPRHRAAVAEAVAWLDRLPDAPMPELRAEALRGAVQALARLTGRVDAEAVLDLVFGEFCIGK